MSKIPWRTAIFLLLSITAVQLFASDLEGTSWTLQQFQSTDDSQPVQQPENSSLYTLNFQSDGRLFMQLNCNQGNDSWQSCLQFVRVGEARYRIPDALIYGG